jgi:hypothetical protein
MSFPDFTFRAPTCSTGTSSDSFLVYPCSRLSVKRGRRETPYVFTANFGNLLQKLRQLRDFHRNPSRSRRTCGQAYLLGPGLINKAPSPNRSIPPIHSSWLDHASMPIWPFNERRLPIKPNKPQTQKRPMGVASKCEA